jgi:uncharacterized protein
MRRTINHSIIGVGRGYQTSTWETSRMNRKFLSAIAFVLVAMLSHSFAQADDPSDIAPWQRDTQLWRAQRAASLKAPEGWLSLIALGWLKEGDNSFGSADDSRIQIAGKGPAHIAVVRLEKNSLRLIAPAEGFPKDLRVDGQPAKDQALFADDADKPSKLTIGTLTIIVIHRDDRFALPQNAGHPDGVRNYDSSSRTRRG